MKIGKEKQEIDTLKNNLNKKCNKILIQKNTEKNKTKMCIWNKHLKNNFEIFIVFLYIFCNHIMFSKICFRFRFY